MQRCISIHLSLATLWMQVQYLFSPKTKIKYNIFYQIPIYWYCHDIIGMTIGTDIQNLYILAT